MWTRVALGLAAATALLAAPARADDPNGAVSLQHLVNAEIDAIKATGTAPSSACLAALQDMHTAEQQLVDLTGESSNAPSGSSLAENEQGEAAVGRDVLGSDMDTASTACRPDATAACAGPGAGKAAKSCALLSRARP